MAEAAAGDAAPAAAPGRGARAGRRGIAAAIAATACAAYATSFLGGYQFDDFRVIVQDARVQSVAAWWRSMPGIRPLLKLGYALNHASGLGLAGFHAVNVAVHAAAAAVAFLLLDRLGRRLPRPPPPAAAAVGALVFALHPVQTEAVTYLSGRSASLAGLLALASALAFVAGRDRGRPWLVHGLSPLLMALSLAVKETAVVLPAALLLLEAARPAGGADPGDGRAGAWGGARAALRAVAVHLAIAAAAAGAFLASPTYRGMVARSRTLRPLGENLLTQARAVAWLTGQLVPVRGLSADPDLPPAAGLAPGPLLALAAIALAAAASVALLRRRPALGLAVLWYLLWLAPQGWWLPRPEPASERQLYLSLLGPAWLVGLCLARLPGPRALRAGLAAALVAGLGLSTAARSLVYRDEVTFWSDAVARAPGNARAHGNLGYALALACRPEEARAAFTRAAALSPGDPQPLVNRRLLREGLLLPEDAAARCRAGVGAGR